MPLWGTGRKKRKQAARALYGAALDRSLHPVFYAAWGVSDDFTGRFDVLCLHATILWRGLKGQGSEGRKLAQALFDVMFREMEQTLRQRGVGDLSVPKHMKRMMRGFRGRALALDSALCGSGEGYGEIEKALIRNLFRDRDPGAAALGKACEYIKLCDDTVVPDLDGKVTFPEIDENGQKEERTAAAADTRMVA